MHQPRLHRARLELGVLRFGQFKLKSGRISPYFFNSGLFNTGYAAPSSGAATRGPRRCSASASTCCSGRPTRASRWWRSTAAALAEHHGRNLPFCFNRKEIKDHGEGGAIVGAPVAGRVLILDDVITAGTAIRETITLLRPGGRQPAGVVMALDRQERGNGELSAIQEVEQNYGIPVASIIRLTTWWSTWRGSSSTASSCPWSRTIGSATGSDLRPEAGQVRAGHCFRLNDSGIIGAGSGTLGLHRAMGSVCHGAFDPAHRRPTRHGLALAALCWHARAAWRRIRPPARSRPRRKSKDDSSGQVYRWVDAKASCTSATRCPRSTRPTDRQVLNQYGVPSHRAGCDDRGGARGREARRQPRRRRSGRGPARRGAAQHLLSVEEIEALRNRASN